MSASATEGGDAMFVLPVLLLICMLPLVGAVLVVLAAIQRER
jgi:hypothetical protein